MAAFEESSYVRLKICGFGKKKHVHKFSVEKKPWLQA